MDQPSAKRKQPSHAQSDRPHKRRPSHPPLMDPPRSHQNGISAVQNETSNGYESDMDEQEEAPSPVQALPTKETPQWQATLERVVHNVVSIHYSQTCAFDADGAHASEATGFVVDAKRGYILTNRHVVGAGPFWGYCVFNNHEECDVYPVYRDPVHDFGILKFDAKAIKHMTLQQLALRPELAKVGVEIRMVGNDAGEKLSILSGVISRLDRNAPEYEGGYCDFNTNYIQAAAAATGGSSGSPVVNIDGHAVALQAGGLDGASTDYFLPLDRPLRALKCIQQGKPVGRGTIQTQWLLRPFDRCKRLGLNADTESEVRAKFPEETSMLVAVTILPDGPAHEKIEEGDVLVKVNGELLTQFVRLDDILDSSVGQKVSLLVQRGGTDIEVEIDVEDLHSITPDRFVSVAGATFHDLSYQQARYYAISLKDAGVYCCEASGSFPFDSGPQNGWVVQSVDNKATPNLNAFIEVMKDIPDRSRVAVQYKHLRDLHTLCNCVIFVDRHWHRHMRMAIRNDETGLWDFSDLADSKPPVPSASQKANFIQMQGVQHPAAADIIRSFVRVNCYVPLKLEGFPRSRKVGYGLVIDAEKGLVVVSRAIVPFDMCDISITIADSIIVDGKVVFMHPLQGYTILQYDPSLVQAPVKSAKLAETGLKQGEETIFFGFNANQRPMIAKTVVTEITPLAIPSSATAPRYRAFNFDGIIVETSLSSSCGSGVLISEEGTVQALWLSFVGEQTTGYDNRLKDVDYHLGLGTPALLPVIDEVKGDGRPNLRILTVEVQNIKMDKARIMGVDESWIERVQREDQEHHQLFMIRKVDADNISPLQEGDIILTLNGALVTRTGHLDVMYDQQTLSAEIVRKSQQQSIELPTVSTSELETDRLVVFCGLIIHRPHHAVRQAVSTVHSGIYISARQRGSPAELYSLWPTAFITAVNGVPVKDLDDFVRETRLIPDNRYFRLKAMTFDNMPFVVTMKKCEHYFPTVEFVKDASVREGWRRVKYEGTKAVKGEGDLMPGGEGENTAVEE